MKLKDRIPQGCRQNAFACIRGNRDGFDCWPPAEPKTWWCWTTVLGWRLVVVVDCKSGSWHLMKGGNTDD